MNRAGVRRRKGVRGMEQQNSPVLSEIIEEQDRITIQFGDSILSLTAGGFTLEQNKSHPHFESTDDSSRLLSE